MQSAPYRETENKVPEAEDQIVPVPGSDTAARANAVQPSSYWDVLSSALQSAAQSTPAPVPDAEITAPTVAADANPEIFETEPVAADVDVQDIEPGSIIGTDSDDMILFTQDLRSIEGGAGTDTLVVQNPYRDAQITQAGDGTLQVNLTPDSPTLILQDVERVAFDDGTLAFDEDGLAGQAYRLYQACFDRAPDAEGLGFWVKQLDAGTITLTDAATFFLNSEEFAAVYAPPTDLADVHYLALLYANVLDRAPDAEGFGFWRDEQAKGVTRADMLVYFSESEENVAQVAPAIDDGIWFV